MPNLNLLTSDEIPILIDFEIIKCSNLIRSVVNNLGFTDEVIPLLKVDHRIMQLVLTWACQHKDDPLLPDHYEDTKMDINDIPEWDKKFLNISQEELLNLTQAATYLHIPKLMEYCYKAVAQLISGKIASEMRDTFGIDNKDEVDTEKHVNNQGNTANNLELSTISLSGEEFLSKKRKGEALESFETEESSLKRKSQEQ